MKYICRQECYVKNDQGKMQRFNIGDEVEYSVSKKVSEYFKIAAEEDKSKRIKMKELEKGK